MPQSSPREHDASSRPTGPGVTASLALPGAVAADDERRRRARARRSAARSHPVPRRAWRSPRRWAGSCGPARSPSRLRATARASVTPRSLPVAEPHRRRSSGSRRGSSPSNARTTTVHGRRGGPAPVGHTAASLGYPPRSGTGSCASPFASNCTGIWLSQRPDTLGVHCSATASANGSKPRTRMRSTVPDTRPSATS